LYLLVLYVNVHLELTTLLVYPVSLLEDTGKYRLEEIIAEIERGMDFDANALIPIYESYLASNLSDENTASKLRDAIRSRLIEDDLFCLTSTPMSLFE